MTLKSMVSYLLLLVILISCEKNQTPEISIDIEELTIEDIHASYRSGDFTSVDLVEAYLEQILKNDSSINAITYLNPDALSVAESLDLEFQQTRELRPLHGIPIIVKDNINVVGMPTTAGARVLANYYPSEDAFIIQRLKEAGAIVLAKSNMAEWAFSPMHSESTTFGTTRNPYNTDFVPAGSSGGTGAAVASNMGTAGLGTDTGNSIRGPSSHCSLVGFRTTLGLISRSGIVPLFLRNDVVGPMCRTVSDATKLMEVMAGIDSSDSITFYSEGKTVGNYQQYLVENGLENARIGVLRALADSTTDPEIMELFENALDDIKMAGAEIIDPVVIPGFAELRKDQWCAVFTEDIETFLAENVKSDSVQTIQDIIRIGTNSEFTRQRLQANAASNGRWGEDDSPCGNAYEDARRIAFRSAIRAVMDSLNLDAIVYPSWKNRPAHIDSFEEEYKGDNNQVISPHTGQPAFTVPMGYISEGLPIGLQFLGRMYDEGTLVKLSYGYEQATQHRKSPE